MYEYEQDQNTIIPSVVTPVLKVFWGRRRAWHGETVKISVRTEAVNDGTKIKLEIRPRGKAVIETFDNLSITNNEYDKDYDIDWNGKGLGNGPEEIVAKATMAVHNLTAEAEMLVDLKIPCFSA